MSSYDQTQHRVAELVTSLVAKHRIPHVVATRWVHDCTWHSFFKDTDAHQFRWSVTLPTQLTLKEYGRFK